MFLSHLVMFFLNDKHCLFYITFNWDEIKICSYCISKLQYLKKSWFLVFHWVPILVFSLHIPGSVRVMGWKRISKLAPGAPALLLAILVDWHIKLQVFFGLLNCSSQSNTWCSFYAGLQLLDCSKNKPAFLIVFINEAGRFYLILFCHLKAEVWEK